MPIIDSDHPYDNIYVNNPDRSAIVSSIKIEGLDGITRTSNEYLILSEILLLSGLIERIENYLLAHNNDFVIIFDMFGKSKKSSFHIDNFERNRESQSNDTEYIYEKFDIKYNEKGRIELNVGIRDLTLIVIMLCIHTFENSRSFVFDLYKHINMFIYHGGDMENAILMDFYNQPSIQAEAIKDNMSITEINNLIFLKFHKLYHLLGNTYNTETIKTQFNVSQIYYLMKALVLVSQFNGETRYLDSSLLLDKCERKCSLTRNGVEAALSNTLLCSIYVFNERYAWFNYERFINYLISYGNTVRILAIFLIDREKWNTLYAMVMLYSIRYIDVNLTNPLFNNVVNLKINQLSRDWLSDSNRAFMYKVQDTEIDNKNNYFIVEIQDRILYISNNYYGRQQTQESYLINEQIANENNNLIDSYIIYNVLNNNTNNVEYICYTIDELKKVLLEYRQGKRGIKMKRPHYNIVNVDDKILPIQQTENNFSSIFTFIFIIGLISIICYFAYSANYIPEREQTIYDNSLT